MALVGSRPSRSCLAVFAALAAVAALGGCHKVWRASTLQPPPLLGASLEARTSLPLVIPIGNMKLPRGVRLENEAYFVVVSKDRLRVHVILRQHAEDFSDPRRWRVTLTDSLGRRFTPAGFDRRHIEPVTIMYEQAYLQRTSNGMPIEGQINYLPLNGVTFFRGDGDYTFYRRGLFRRDVRWMMLVLERPGYEYRYVWSFADDPDERPARSRIAASAPVAP